MYQEADFFAVGVTLYLMVSGRYPFNPSPRVSKYPYGNVYNKLDSDNKAVNDLCYTLCTKIHSKGESIHQYYLKVYNDYISARKTQIAQRARRF